MKYLHHYKGSFFFTILGLILGFFVGYHPSGSLSLGLEAFFICMVLAILEISLSFDNAVVNARILENMSPIWQRRFLTIGIFVAVFLMRIIFPIVIVSMATGLNPFAALQIAIANENLYAKIMGEAHLSVSAFGGTFLLFVALSYFFDPKKEHHWIRPIEQLFVKMAFFPAVSVFIVTFVLVIFVNFIPLSLQATFLLSALYGLLTFLAIDGLGNVLEGQEKAIKNLKQGGVMAFLYLEVLDASFSLDGVIGAFALSKNIFIIAIGLGIGAFYVRSMTIMLVKEKTLSTYRYLEHGAFYAIFVLGLMMYASIIAHIPEYITGLIGVLFIASSFFHSWYEKKQSLEESS